MGKICISEAAAQLEQQLLEFYPEIERLDIQTGIRVFTSELVEKSLKKLGAGGQVQMERDCYGAPYVTGQEIIGDSSRPDHRISVASTEDTGCRICLTAVHSRKISGIGIDFAVAEEFAGMFADGVYCGGRMFTESEQEWMNEFCGTDGAEETIKKQLLLAELFSGKEAALKSLSNVIREKIPEKEAVHWRMEFKEFEVRPGKDGRKWAVPFGRTAETVGFLGIDEIELVTVRCRNGAGAWAGAITAAVCL